MGQIADDMVNGLMCSGCGVCFEKEHGYPVLCASCLKATPKAQRIGCQRAIHKEL